MKTLYLIGGTMGVGKSTVGWLLSHKTLQNAVFLDGDWCWDATPFTVTNETKTMVMDNVCHLLGNFLRCSEYQNVVFCWVMHEQSIIDEILSRLDLKNTRVISVSLTCTETVLRSRLQADIDAGKRSADVIERSVARLPCYNKLGTVLIDTTKQTVTETAELLSRL